MHFLFLFGTALIPGTGIQRGQQTSAAWMNGWAWRPRVQDQKENKHMEKVWAKWWLFVCTQHDAKGHWKLTSLGSSSTLS